MTGHSNIVRSGTTRYRPNTLRCGVPQGPIPGPILFLLYTVDLWFDYQAWTAPHLFAHDTQFYDSCAPTDVDAF